MNNGIDLLGKIFGRLEVLRREGTGNSGNILWRCRCDCGKEIVTTGNHLRTNHTTSCGCYSRDIHTTHGMTGSMERSIWNSMIQRCTNPNNSRFESYGGRGIKVCERWLNSFSNFYEDMGDKPKGLSLDREDNDGPYCKNNCRWATREEQNNNKRNTLKFEDGTPVSEWSTSNKFNHENVRYLFRKGHTKNDIYNILSI